MREHFSIAIDGPSGAGKSSLARRLAEELHFIYVDTGAIYRTVGLAALRAGVDRQDEHALKDLLPKIKLSMAYDDEGQQRMYLDGEDVSAEIRLPEISLCASQVSALPAVREYLLDMQRQMARENDVIMDGRDIGTVVLPDAQLKIFLTASPEARARRRKLELEQKGIDMALEKVLEDMRERDEKDSSRAAAPLKAAEDAVLVDTSEINFEDSLSLLKAVAAERLELEGSL